MPNNRYAEKEITPGDLTTGEPDQRMGQDKKKGKIKKMSRKARNMKALHEAKKMKGSHHVLPAAYD